MKQRLTSLETLPESTLADCQWLYDAIKTQRMDQVDMLAEFNSRLAAAGHLPISRSSLNRYVMKVRGGAVKRPRAISATPADAAESPIFADEFRRKLVEKQGVHAVTMLEASLSVLAQSRNA